MQELAIFATAVAAGAALGFVALRLASPEILGRRASAPAPSAPETSSTARSSPTKTPRAAPEPLHERRAVSVEAAPRPQPAADVAPAPPEAAEGTATEEPSRRQHERLKSDEPILVTPFGGSETMAEVCDVSLGGVRFRVVGLALRADDMVRLTFNLDGESLSAVARVLRTQPLDDITTEVAAVFARLDPWAARRFEAALSKEG